MIKNVCAASVPSVNVLPDCCPVAVAYLVDFLSASSDWVEEFEGLSWTDGMISIACPEFDTIATRGPWSVAAAFLSMVKFYQLQDVAPEIAARLADDGTVF